MLHLWRQVALEEAVEDGAPAPLRRDKGGLRPDVTSADGSGEEVLPQLIPVSNQIQLRLFSHPPTTCSNEEDNLYFC